MNGDDPTAADFASASAERANERIARVETALLALANGASADVIRKIIAAPVPPGMNSEGFAEQLHASYTVPGGKAMPSFSWATAYSRLAPAAEAAAKELGLRFEAAWGDQSGERATVCFSWLDHFGDRHGCEINADQSDHQVRVELVAAMRGEPRQATPVPAVHDAERKLLQPTDEQVAQIIRAIPDETPMDPGDGKRALVRAMWKEIAPLVLEEAAKVADDSLSASEAAAAIRAMKGTP